MFVGGDDRRDARFRVVFLGTDGHAAGGDDLQRLEGLAIHDGELWRPVVAGDHVLVLVALVLRSFNRAGLDADLDFSDLDRLLAPQVDHVDFGIATDDQQVTTRSGHARDMHCITGVDGLDDLLAVTVDEGDLAVVTQGDGEQVRQVQLVHLLFRPIFRLDQHIPGILHLLHPPLGRGRRSVLDVLGHQRDLVLGQRVGRPPVRHTGRRTIGDQRFQIGLATLLGDVRRQRLAGRALAQHTVTAGAALEVDFLGLLELGARQIWRTRRMHNLSASRIDRRRLPLVGRLSGLGVRCGLGNGQTEHRKAGDEACQ